MEILTLSLLHPSSEVPADEPSALTADLAPHFLLTPAGRLPAKRLFEAFTVQSTVALVALAAAWLFGSGDPQRGTRIFPEAGYTPIRITFYRPPAPKNRPSEVSPSRVKTGYATSSTPAETVHPMHPPAPEPLPTIVGTPTEAAPQLPDRGLPLPPPLIPAVLQLKAGVPNVPAAPVANLDPSPLRSVPFRSPDAGSGRDPLGSAGLSPQPSGPGSNGGGKGDGPPDLSAKPPAAVKSERPQERLTNTKPQISFMPKPVYPPRALAEKTEGDVTLQVTFAKTGRVIFNSFIHRLQNEELNAAARETVERIQFTPAMRNGVPADQESVVTVFFRLNQLNMTAAF
jgi:TonB family protein